MVLTRKANQAIRIGGEVEVRILEISEGQVRLGVVAPRHIPVHREEVYRAIQEANREAAGTAPHHVAAALAAWCRDSAARDAQG